MDFYSTVGGHRFIEGTVPKLIHSIERLAKAMERANILKMKELSLAGVVQESEEQDERHGDELADTDGEGA